MKFSSRLAIESEKSAKEDSRASSGKDVEEV